MKPLPIHNEEGYHQSLFFLRLFCFVFFLFFFIQSCHQTIKNFYEMPRWPVFSSCFYLFYFFYFFFLSLWHKSGHTQRLFKIYYKRLFLKALFFFSCSFNLWSDICIFTIYKRKIRRKKTERSVDTSILGRGLDGRESFTFNAQEMTSMSLSLWLLLLFFCVCVCSFLTYRKLLLL